MAEAATPANTLTMHSGGSTLPVPDPTELTRIALVREIAALREILEGRIAGDKQVIDTRLTAADEAIKLVRAQAAELPSRVDEKVANRAAICSGQVNVINQQFLTVAEQFAGIDKQFDERDQRVRDSRTADAAALAAALQAAKEAVSEANKAFTISIDKSERATSDQIKQGAAAAEINFRAVNEKIDALDKRVTRSEGQGAGQGQLWGWIAGAVGLLATILVIVERLATP